jgi:8-oxo-dGTP pyrophosphatase MutT (NUDIX family)
MAPHWLREFENRIDGLRDDAFLYNIRPKAEDIESVKKGAVLILLHDGASGPEVLITLRSEGLRSHSGQPSFPGGAIEKEESAIAAALRESSEEVGLTRESVDVLAELPQLFIPPSNFHVTPILGFWREPHPLTAERSEEVVRAEMIALDELANPANRIMLRHRSGYRGPAFDVAGMRIWGFTGGILDRLLHHGGFEREWNQERTVELEL